MLESRNVRFMLDCYLIATGDSEANGVAMTEIARKCGVTKEAVSKRCIRICEFLRLPPSRYMRSEQSRATFRLTNVRRTPNFTRHSTA